MKLTEPELHAAYSESAVVDSTDDLIQRFCTGRYVLDVGCANYAGTEQFGAASGQIRDAASRYVGIDLDARVRDLPSSNKARYVQASAETFLEPEHFEVVYCGDVIEHLSNVGAFLGNASKMLAPRGRVVIVTPNPNGLRNLVGLARDFEPPQHTEHTCLLAIRNMNELFGRHGLRLESIIYVRGQDPASARSLRGKLYCYGYTAILKNRPFRRLADTLALVATLADA